ncbi:MULTISPECIES: MerR family transcriptional regulator [Pediococcus]|uniref:MerR family transcriptional regulator n=1 Tax=Pediococcus TaxID=1253 RepID=UPI000E8EE0F4|nr:MULTISPECIES: MerR family transcriptional regulator [Pediococcus]MCT3028945.1 MerR family transcriptional regulator [Pediococcus parvulus]HBO47779.1 MerR family transcriptional regulator [Pediococcus sp.]
MTYTIKEVAAKVNLSIYTLRFYDKQGLLPFVARNAAGYREFTVGDLNLLKTICCLKNTGMKIKDIRKYIDYVMAGPASVKQRRELLPKHRQEVVAQQKKIEQNLAEVDYKINMYTAPDAEKSVSNEIALAIADKVANHLPNPYEMLQK